MMEAASSVEPHEEIWVFGGSRVGSKGQRIHAWLPLDTNDELYFPVKGTYVVGSMYRVKVLRNGERVSKFPNPVYHGQHQDAGRRSTLEVEHRSAEMRLRLAALERNDKRRSALDEVLRPIEELFRASSPMDREPLLVYIMRRLSRV